MQEPLSCGPSHRTSDSGRDAILDDGVAARYHAAVDEHTGPAVPGPLSGGPSPLEQRSHRTMSVGRRLFYAVAAPVVAAAVKTLWATCRFTVTGGEVIDELGEAGQRMVLTMWHEHVGVAARQLSRLGRVGVNVTYLVSPSVDGELAVGLLRRIGGSIVRGSATRSGVKAMHGLYRAMVRANASPVVLPDGPQGPRRSCKPGSLLLARTSGAPVVPMACAASAAWRLRTWDRQLLPRPFSRVAIVVGEPFTVPSGASDEELERHRAHLEEQLDALEKQAIGLVSR
jgi:lysophospholipid acyltransferase (LPLAT)-like uncharacterized protein